MFSKYKTQRAKQLRKCYSKIQIYCSLLKVFIFERIISLNSDKRFYDVK